MTINILQHGTLRQIPWRTCVFICWIGLVSAVQEKSVCGNTIFANPGDIGVITSPQFPNNYPPYLNCLYVIKAPTGHRITVTFTSFELEEMSRYYEICLSDYIEVYERTLNSRHVHNRFCGSTKPSPIRSFGDHMSILFYTDDSNEYSGFRLEYYVETALDDTFLMLTTYVPNTLDGSLIRMDTMSTTSHRLDLFNRAGRILAVAYDVSNENEKRLFWSVDVGTNFILTTTFQRLHISEYFSGGVHAEIRGLAVDPASRLLIHTDSGQGRIILHSLISGNQKTVFQSNFSQPSHLALDTTNGIMYWTDVAKIQKSTYNGQNKELVYRSSGEIIDMTLDQFGNKLYIITMTCDEILMISMAENNHVTSLIEHNGYNFRSVTFIQNMLFIVDQQPNGESSVSTILRQKVSHTGTRSGLISVLMEYHDEVVSAVYGYHYAAESIEQNGCSNGSSLCEDFCMPLQIQEHICQCGDGMILAQNNSCFPDGMPPVQPPPPVFSGCDVILTNLTGRFQSLHFPNHYDENSVCIYEIRVPEGYRITLTFSALHLQRGQSNLGCIKDYVEIWDVALLDRICGGLHDSPSYRSTYNYLKVVFISDGSVTSMGFQANYMSDQDYSFILMTHNFPVTSNIMRFDPVTLSKYSINISHDHVTAPKSVGYDDRTERIYWADLSDSFCGIRYCHMNGSGLATAINLGHTSMIFQIVVDVLSRLIVYTDAGSRRAIGAVSLPDHGHRILLNVNDTPQAIALDIHIGEMYWSEKSQNGSRIFKCPYTGIHITHLIVDDLIAVNSIVLDLPGEKMYFLDVGTNKLEVVNLDGTDRLTLLHYSPPYHLFSIAHLYNLLYVAIHTIRSWSIVAVESFVLEIKLDATTSRCTSRDIISLIGDYSDIYAYQPVSDNVENGCSRNKGGCEEFCFPSPGNRRSCGCGSSSQLVSETACQAHVMVTPTMSTVTPFFLTEQPTGDCGGHFVQPTASFHSPGYPFHYDSNMRCVYTISAPRGHRIYVKFNAFDLYNDRSCSFDYLLIRDHGSYEDSSFENWFCGSSLPQPFRSFSNFLFLEFISVTTRRHTGFHLSYYFVTDDSYIILSMHLSWRRLNGYLRIMDTVTNMFYENTNVQIHGTANAVALDTLDGLRGRMYWVETQHFSIILTTTDLFSQLGSDVFFVSDDEADILDLKLDIRSRILFYSDAHDGAVVMISLIDRSSKTVFRGGNKVEGLTLDTDYGDVYWMSSGENQIEWCKYDGSQRTLLGSGVDQMNSVAFDIANGRMYWVNGTDGILRSSTLSGDDEKTVLNINSTTYEFINIDMFRDAVYILYYTNLKTTGSDYYGRSRMLVQRVDTNGEAVMSCITKFETREFLYFSVVNAGRENSGANGCSNNSYACKHFCMPLANMSYRCLCPDHMAMSSTGACLEDGSEPSSKPHLPVHECVNSSVHVTGEGYIQSPNFPLNYDDNTLCFYHLVVPDGFIINLTFISFVFEKAFGVHVFDKLQIHDGGSKESPILLILYGYWSEPFSVTSSSNHMWILFESDDSNTASGFRGHYTAIVGHSLDNFLLMTSSEPQLSFGDFVLKMDVDTLAVRSADTTLVRIPTAISYDPTQSLIYWSEDKSGRILAASFHGTFHTIIRPLRDGAAKLSVQGVFVDHLSKLLLYTCSGQWIGAVSTVNQTHRVLINTTNIPHSITADCQNGTMYWSELSQSGSMIFMATYNGTNRVKIVESDLVRVTGLALDFERGILYWIDSGNNKVESYDILYNRRQLILHYSTDQHLFMAIAYSNNAIYVTDRINQSALYPVTSLLRISANDFVQREVEVLKTFNSYVNFIYAFSVHNNIGRANGCQDNVCSQLCFPAPDSRMVCACQDHYILSDDGMSCVTRRVTVMVTVSPAVPMDTDGSRALTFACVSDTHTVISYKWNIDCVADNHSSNTCRFVPAFSDDGKVVRCSVHTKGGESGSGIAEIVLNYPPLQSPVIVDSHAGRPQHAGDRLFLTCSAHGGKPPVKNITIICPPSLPAADHGYIDRGNGEAMSAFMVIDSVSVTDDGLRCECSATWKVAQWYTLVGYFTINVRVNDSKLVFIGVTTSAIIVMVIVLSLILIIRKYALRRKWTLSRSSKQTRNLAFGLDGLADSDKNNNVYIASVTRDSNLEQRHFTYRNLQLLDDQAGTSLKSDGDVDIATTTTTA